ncbi:phage tail tube protein [Chachezhania antarctica]|uniref:phage tail tube protein n=1 Tax=Chachezhania antarctica TaxID=2340860 RepID=UPI000EB498D9|nr:phage tail tube protein [Chachezhania antarctica]
MPIKWKSKILLAKIESTYGTDPTPVGTDAVLATDVQLTPMEGSDVDRDLETPWLGATGTIPTELHAMLRFKVELAPSGTAGTAPAWGTLLRACAVAETVDAGVSVTYNPVSDGHESVTLYLLIGATRYVMLGSRGNCTVEVNAQGIVYLNFEFTGLFTLPTEQTRPTVDLSAYQKPLLATNANTPTFQMEGEDFVMRSFNLNLGNSVETRFLIGSEGVLITDRAETVETVVEAVPLSAFDPFTLAAGQTGVEIDLVHGTTAGSIAAINIPTAQMQRPQGLNNSQNIKEWPLRLVPLPITGNDQWTLTLT